MFHAPFVRRILGCHLLLLSAEAAEDRVPQRKVLLAYLGDDDRDRVMQGVDALPFAVNVVEGLNLLHRAVCAFDDQWSKVTAKRSPSCTAARRAPLRPSKGRTNFVSSSADGSIPSFPSSEGILDVTKPELGTKRRCNSCEAKFFDLNTDPIICPKCLAVFIPPQAEPVRARRLPDGKPWPARKMAVPKVPHEFESLEETKVDTETGAPAADPEEGDGDLILLDEQDDGKLDAPEIVGVNIGKDDP